MKLKPLSSALLMSLGLAFVAGAAHATNYVEIDGTNVQFFYDADFWGENTATVTGNSISFDIGSDYSVLAKVKATSTNGWAQQNYTDSANPGLIAVAKTGFQMLGGLDVSVAGHYSTAANGGYVITTAAGYLHNGSFSGGVFEADPSKYGYYTAADLRASSGTAASGALFGATQTGSWDGLQAMSVDASLTSYAQQSGPGLSSAALTNVSYGFGVIAAPVPEPETYAMLLAGLGLVGAIARRRKANA